MNGLKLIAAGLCGSALTLGLTTWAQAPKKPAWEAAPIVACPDTGTTLFHLERDVSKMSEKLDVIAADQKSTLQWAQWVSGDLAELKMRR